MNNSTENRQPPLDLSTGFWLVVYLPFYVLLLTLPLVFVLLSGMWNGWPFEPRTVVVLWFYAVGPIAVASASAAVVWALATKGLSLWAGVVLLASYVLTAYALYKVLTYGSGRGGP